MKIEVFHEYPSETRDKGLILLPVGVMYNKPIQKAHVGDSIVFLGGEVCPILDMAYIKIATQSFGVLCNYIYGTSFKVIFGRWKANAVAEGNSSRALSNEKCLLVWYEKIENPKEKKKPSSKKNQRLST